MTERMSVDDYIYEILTSEAADVVNVLPVSLNEGSRVGVKRSSQGELHFFINGIDLGLAATGVPPHVRAVVDLYGKCYQVTIVDAGLDYGTIPVSLENDATLGCSSNSDSQADGSVNNTLSNELKFHDCTGSLVVLSNNGKTAERKRPFDEFNNGVVMTHRPLRNDEIFEIRLDRVIDKWSGSIEVGITTHSPDKTQFPATMTNMKSGTVMMSGCGILTNGKGTKREYGDYNLDELIEGDRIGLMRKSDDTLIYFINGIDQGIAATDVPSRVYGVVDLYGMTAKVTIVGPEERNQQGLANHRNNTLIREFQLLNKEIVNKNLLFHWRCGKNVTVLNNDRTAQRPSPVETFDNAVVLTKRPLRIDEIFEVQLDEVVDKWMGSLEIGVTTHNPNDLDFPSTMTNVRSGTWMMTGSGIMQDGVMIVEQYGHNLDLLKVGDRIGVQRNSKGELHFYLNGTDLGLAVSNVPEQVYGAIDLFGQAAKATIVHTNDLPIETDDIELDSTMLSTDLRFHHLRGENARITNNGRTASRPNAQSEFNSAIVISSRPLLDGEMFEVTIDKMVDRWSGSIEAGITLIKPEELTFPATMTDINHNTWMLSGSAIMKDGLTILNGYKCNLDSLTTGMRIGMMRCPDATLHYYVDGEDMGIACRGIPEDIYAVIDLYGQCAQVTIVQPSFAQSRLSDSVISPQTHTETLRASVVECFVVTHSFSSFCGKNVTLSSNKMVAFRTRGFSHGIVFGGSCLQPNEIFEVEVQKVKLTWSGSLRIGVTTLKPSECYSADMALPTHAALLSTGGDTWLAIGNKILKNGRLLLDNYGVSLDCLNVGDRIGVKRCVDGKLHIFRNGEDGGVAVVDLPKGVYIIVDVYGSVEKISIVSKITPLSASLALHIDSSRERRLSVQSEHSRDSLERDFEEPKVNDNNTVLEFHELHSRNIVISDNLTHAKRITGFNNGVLFSRKPLQCNQLFQVRIERLNYSWTSSIVIGITTNTPDKYSYLVSAFGLKKPWWLICGDGVFHNGHKVKSRYSINLDQLQMFHTVGVLIDDDCRLHLYVNGLDQGVACTSVAPKCFAVVDIYGQCEEVRVWQEKNINEVDSREKANLERKWKEKYSKFPIISNLCAYQESCIRFKLKLGLPDGYFSNEACVCFCDNCYERIGDATYQRKGDPPKDYSIPFGWCQFRLKLPLKEENVGIIEKWHVAFHGVQPSIIRRILDLNELVLPEDTGLCASIKKKSQKSKSKDADVEANQICFSPTIHYAANNLLTPKFEFFDAKLNRTSFARTVFQVLVQPGTYNSGPQRIGAREPIDNHFNNNEIEWLTKEKGAIKLHSLLVRIENL